MNAPVRYAFQGVLYAAFVAFVGYFASAPRYEHLTPDEALVRLSLSHGAQNKEPCRKRTPAELAKLPPNMRAPLDCPRERAPVVVELEMDGKLVYRVVAPPAGLARDGASTVYRRLTVKAGRHDFRVRLSDNAKGEFNYAAERSIELAPGKALLIDFSAREGGFVFRM
jgi:hypothetical protein